MLKNRITTNHGIHIGADSETLLNILLGFNSTETISNEYNKISTLTERNYGVSIITDLSLYDVPLKEKLWKKVLNETNFIAGTVPIYLAKKDKKLINKSYLLEIIQQQAEEGVGIITIHPTPTRNLVEMSKNRLIPFTSRGGGVIIKDLLLSKQEKNVYIQILDPIIKIANKNKTIISIGSAFRSASIVDSYDETYQEELKLQFSIAEYMTEKGVQVIIETPGHSDPRNIFKICDVLNNEPYPIMPLGPMPTDIAGSEDDTAAAIGAALMGTNSCADILSVVTKEEHTGGIPTLDSLIQAIRKYKVVKHIIDLYKIKDTREDFKVSYERGKKRSCLLNDNLECERCGDICPLKLNLY